MENTDNKNAQQNTKVLWGVAGLWSGLLALMIAYVVGVYKQNQANQKTYIVTDKENYKIVYAPFSDRTDLHVMEFGPFDTDSLWYKYINVGDTIVGDGRKLNKPVSAATLPYLDERINVIYRVNGLDNDALKAKASLQAQIARRDSMLRTMRQNQK